LARRPTLTLRFSSIATIHRTRRIDPTNCVSAMAQAYTVAGGDVRTNPLNSTFVANRPPLLVPLVRVAPVRSDGSPCPQATADQFPAADRPRRIAALDRLFEPARARSPAPADAAPPHC